MILRTNLSDIHCSTHVDRDAVAVEDCCLGAVGGEVPVELVAVPVPLDRVQLVALNVSTRIFMLLKDEERSVSSIA